MFLDGSKHWSDFFKRHNSNIVLKSLEVNIDDCYSKQECYPPKELIFQAFKQCKFETLKVVVLGQDPYHGLGQAHGLAFSVPLGVPHPPSLKNIFIELTNDQQLAYPINGSLENWAKQGVLLLNAALSVEKAKPGSHFNLWKPFTQTLLKALSDEKSGLIFVLWGSFAQKYKSFIDPSKHYILETGHPSPLSANRGYWFGNRHFSKINSILKSQEKEIIDWTL